MENGVSAIQAIILGIVQGITEFLPISSSGHMSLVKHIFNYDMEASGLLSAMLHLGTLVAIIIYFYIPIYDLFCEFILCFKDIKDRKFTLNVSKMSATRRMLFMFVISCIPLLFLLIPVGGGNNIMDAVEVFSTDDRILAEGICLLLTGLFLLFGMYQYNITERHKKIGPSAAFFIGIAQFFAACFPGISRSGSTISAGLCCKASKKSMVRYSFILSIPAVLASCLVELKDSFSAKEYVPVTSLLLGFITSAVVGLFAVKLLRYIIKGDRLKYFGYYCMGIGALTSVIGVIESFKH